MRTLESESPTYGDSDSTYGDCSATDSFESQYVLMYLDTNSYFQAAPKTSRIHDPLVDGGHGPSEISKIHDPLVEGVGGLLRSSMIHGGGTLYWGVGGSK